MCHPCAIAQIPPGVIAPTLHRIVVKNGARVRVMYGDGLGRPASPKANRHGSVSVRSGSITNLSVTVFAPTLE